MSLLVPVGRSPAPERREDLLDLARLGADIVRPSGGDIRVVHFEEIPEQLDLAAATDRTPGEVELEPDDGELAADLDVPVEFGEVVTHDTKRSVASFVDHHDVDVVLGEWHPSRWHAELLGADVDWYMRHTERDFVFVRNRGYRDVETITVIADRGPFDPLEIVIADNVASAHGATIRFVATLGESAVDEQIEGLVEATTSTDLAIVGTSAHHVVYDVLFGSVPDRLVERLDCTVLLTHSGRPRRHTFLWAVLERFVY